MLLAKNSKLLLISQIILFFGVGLTEGGVGQKWVARNQIGHTINGIAVDNYGNVYVTGDTWSYTAGYMTIKYNSNGNQQWAKYFYGPGDITSGDEIPSGIALDSLGNIYVTGSSGGGTITDFATIKYDTYGYKKWVTYYNRFGGADYPNAIVIDSSNNIYVTGRSYNAYSHSGDYATIKYDSNGNQIWASFYDGPANNEDEAKAIAVDNSGNVFVTGSSIGFNMDFATIKYDSNGNQIWVSRYNGQGNYNDAAYSIALDNSGNIYVTGYTCNTSISSTIATIKYDPNGNQKWTAFYECPGNDRGWADAIAIDHSGNIYVTGSTGMSTDHGVHYDSITIKYNQDGNQIWAAQYNIPQDGIHNTSSIALDNSDNIYVTGYSSGMIKYNPEGKLLWEALYPGTAICIVVDDANYIYISGNESGNQTYNFLTIKYSQCGDINHPYPAGDLNSDCRVNFFDYSLFANNWFIVNDFYDLAELANTWLACTDITCP